jgi:hypothetical protein
MECYVIDAILNGEQRVREEDYLRRQMERDSAVPQQAGQPRWQALSALLGRDRERNLLVAAQDVTATAN